MTSASLIKQVMNIDSTNMRPQNWLQIRAIIESVRCLRRLYYPLSSTMAYTAAALSYLIQNSEKPIVLTGSQQPWQIRSLDAKLQLLPPVLTRHDRSVEL